MKRLVRGLGIHVRGDSRKRSGSLPGEFQDPPRSTKTKKFLNLVLVLGLFALAPLAVNAQTTSAIGGTVVDTTGAVVPNASVVAKGLSGREFTASTSDNGTYVIPAVPSGIYTVSVTAPRFKTSMRTNVKVDAGVP